ncbi:unnamed protein product [Orchesella dallaii]|uniref:Uncharacterized protein n=1 Tax=Orchesella dallaii TaxID=48710 RepID=A0ABP1QJR3_9HEXA
MTSNANVQVREVADRVFKTFLDVKSEGENQIQVSDKYTQFDVLWQGSFHSENIASFHSFTEIDENVHRLKEQLDNFELKLQESAKIVMEVIREMRIHFGKNRRCLECIMAAQTIGDLGQIEIPSLEWLQYFPDPEIEMMVDEWEALQLDTGIPPTAEQSNVVVPAPGKMAGLREPELTDRDEQVDTSPASSSNSDSDKEHKVNTMNWMLCRLSTRTDGVAWCGMVKRNERKEEKPTAGTKVLKGSPLPNTSKDEGKREMKRSSWFPTSGPSISSSGLQCGHSMAVVDGRKHSVAAPTVPVVGASTLANKFPRFGRPQTKPKKVTAAVTYYTREEYEREQEMLRERKRRQHEEKVKEEIRRAEVDREQEKVNRDAGNAEGDE